MAELRVERRLDVPGGGAAGTLVAAPAEQFAGDPEQWLPLHSRRRGRSRWGLQLAAGPARWPVTFAIGSVWRVGDATWRSITWAPDPQHGQAVPVERALPSFTGELGVADDGHGTVLRLRGCYRPPGGTLGALADALALRRVAQATADDLLLRIAERLVGE